MKRIITTLILLFLVAFLSGETLGAQIYRTYYLASDVEPNVFIAREVYFLESWGSNTPSESFIEICAANGERYVGRLVKISTHEIALSQGYYLKKDGERVEKQVVVPKRDVIIAKIYW